MQQVMKDLPQMTDAETQATHDLLNYMRFVLPPPQAPRPEDDAGEVLEKGLDLFMWVAVVNNLDPSTFPNANVLRASVDAETDHAAGFLMALELAKVIASDRVVIGDDGGMFVAPRGINGWRWIEAIKRADGSAMKLLEETLKREVKYTKSSSSMN